MSVDKNKWKLRLQELKNKELISSEQQETLSGMLKSSDKENFKILEILVNNIIKDKLSEALNEGQKKAYYDIIEFIDDPKNDQAVVLKGYAGTGKTFLVKRLIEYIGQTDHSANIAISAPTNKAVKVLYKSAIGNVHGASSQVFEDIFNNQSRLTYSTIHKLLGLKEKISADGKQTFEAANTKDSKLHKYKYLIVDEVSMLNDTLCKVIMQFSKTVKIIFMGDSAQIPPVGSIDCIPFNPNTEYFFKRVALTEIMRQKGDNSIISSSFILRENLSKYQPIPKLSTRLNSENNGIVYFNTETEKDKIRPLLEKYFKTDLFKQNSDYMKVVAWRNVRVAYVNEVVREILFGKDCGKFEINEKMIAQKPIYKYVESKKYGNYWKLLLNTSDEFTICDIYESSFHKTLHGYSIDYVADSLDVEYEDVYGETQVETIHIIQDQYIALYKAFKSNIYQIAKNCSGTLKVRQELWKDYFNTNKWTANVNYNYAISSHKSQGSTYENVLVLEDDIDCNRNIVERNRIKYTSYTRASKILYILRKNY
jgi:hypothetical protein